jgi:hypothetical protein
MRDNWMPRDAATAGLASAAAEQAMLAASANAVMPAALLLIARPCPWKERAMVFSGRSGVIHSLVEALATVLCLGDS